MHNNFYMKMLIKYEGIANVIFQNRQLYHYLTYNSSLLEEFVSKEKLLILHFSCSSRRLLVFGGFFAKVKIRAWIGFKIFSKHT